MVGTDCPSYCHHRWAFGFSGVAAGAAWVSKTLFGIFLAIFIVLLVLAILGIRMLV
jgi:uncharacterized membrane protein YtjA (UPF0391 family)